MHLLNKIIAPLCCVLLINNIVHSTGECENTPTQEAVLPKNEWIIFDGVRHMSYNMACCLVDNNIPCTVVVRPTDLPFADMRLPRSSLITVITLDFSLSDNNAALDEIGIGGKYLFLDPESDTYATWHTSVLTITRNALYVAKKQNLTVIYPGRIYPFGHPTRNIITDQSYFSPSSAQGLTLSTIESLLQQASHKKECKVRIIRSSYLFGPAIYDYLLSSTFKEAKTLGRMTWLFRTDKPHQFCFAYDVARLALLLSQTKPDPYHLTVNFSGYTYDSVEAFGHAICQSAGKTLQQRTVSKFQLTLVCYIEPNAERGADLINYFEQPVYLEDSPLLIEELNFSPTPPDEAIKKTIEWFNNHPNTRGVFSPNQ